MASANIFDICTCGTCLQTFDESSKSPRMLPCGHSFCLSCLGRLLASNQSCPTCRAEILFQSPESFPINYSLISLINFRSHILMPNTSTNLGGFIEAAYKELRKQVSQRVEEELSQRKTRADILTKSLREFKEESKFLIEEIKRKELELKVCEKRSQELEKRIPELESLKLEENKFCDKLKQLQTMVDNSANDAALSKNLIELEKLLEEGKKQILIDLPLHLLQTREALGTLCQSRSVYAVEDRYDGTRYGKVALKDGRILVASFQQEKPEDATLCATFQLPELLSRFNKGSSELPKTVFLRLPELLSRFNNGSSELPKTVFLTLTPGEYDSEDDYDDNSEDVEVIIETDGHTPRAKNFILLCSALKGPSYKTKGVTPEDYSSYYQIYPAPPPVIEGVRNDDPETPQNAGGVYGMGEGDSTFQIRLMGDPSYSDTKFGVVVAGLQEMKNLRGYDNCYIRECGLVI